MCRHTDAEYGRLVFAATEGGASCGLLCGPEGCGHWLGRRQDAELPSARITLGAWTLSWTQKYGNQLLSERNHLIRAQSQSR
jgi:hypothetical protein